MNQTNKASATITSLQNIFELIREFEQEVKGLENTVAYCKEMGTEPSKWVLINLSEAKELLAENTAEWNKLLKTSTL